MYINSNINAETFFKYYCKDENAKEFYERFVEKHNKAIDENASLYRRNEMLSEQLGFAIDIINHLEDKLKEITRMSEFKKEFIRVLEDSYLER